jgi:hypothetical protein
MSRDFNLVSRNYSYHREDCSHGFPALGAATSMVVCHVTVHPYFDFVTLTTTMERAASEAGCTLLDTGVY